jgi:hypothetical protein
MDRGTATRAAAEAANQTATGFFQGIGFAAGVGALGVLGALIFHHPYFLLLSAVAGAVGAYKWQIRRRAQKQADIQIRQ